MSLRDSRGIFLKGYPAGNEKVCTFLPFIPSSRECLGMEKWWEVEIRAYSAVLVDLEVLYMIFGLP